MKVLPFFAQECPESCVPACVRMLLAYYDIICSEAEVYACCETDSDGTLPSAAARCLQKFGLRATSERLTGGIEMLKEHCLVGHVIVFVNLAPLLGVPVIHAVVVESIESQPGQLTVLDPAFPPKGQRLWSIGLFEIGWQLARNQVITISKITNPLHFVNSVE